MNTSSLTRHTQFVGLGATVDNTIDCGDFLQVQFLDNIAPIAQKNVTLSLSEGVEIEEVYFEMSHPQLSLVVPANELPLHNLLKNNKIKLSTLVNSIMNEHKPPATKASTKYNEEKEKRPVGIVCISLSHEQKNMNKLVAIELKRSVPTNGTVLSGFHFDSDGPSIVYAHCKTLMKATNNLKKRTNEGVFSVGCSTAFEPPPKKVIHHTFNHQQQEDASFILSTASNTDNTPGNEIVSNGTNNSCGVTPIASHLAQISSTDEEVELDNNDTLFLPWFPYFYDDNYLY